MSNNGLSGVRANITTKHHSARFTFKRNAESVLTVRNIHHVQSNQERIGNIQCLSTFKVTIVLINTEVPNEQCMQSQYFKVINLC